MYDINVLQDTPKSTYDVNIPGNNSQKSSVVFIEYSYSYIIELIQKVQENQISFADYR